MSDKSPQSPLSRRQATALWERVFQSLFEAQRAITEIVRQRAWEPLGFLTFTDAWNARMSELTIFPELRSHVIYQMFSEGASDDQIAAAVKGTGPETVRSLRRQRNHGVPANRAVAVRPHTRSRPSAPEWIHVQVGADDHSRFSKLAAEFGDTVENIASEAIRARFAELEG